MALVGIVFAAISKTLPLIFGSSSKGGQAVDNELQRETVRLAMANAINKAIPGMVYLDLPTADAIGIGTRLGLTAASFPATALGSLLVAPISQFNALADVVPAASSGPFDVLAVLQKDPAVPLLTLSSVVTLASGTVSLPVSGTSSPTPQNDITKYSQNDVIAVSSPIGAEFFIVNAAPAGSALSIQNSYANAPATYFPVGTEVYKVNVILIGVDATKPGIRMVSAAPAPNAFVSRGFFSMPPLSLFQVQYLKSPLDLTTWTSLGGSIFQPGTTQNMLRMQWQRPTTTRNTAALSELEISL